MNRKVGIAAAADPVEGLKPYLPTTNGSCPKAGPARRRRRRAPAGPRPLFMPTLSEAQVRRLASLRGRAWLV